MERKGFDIGTPMALLLFAVFTALVMGVLSVSADVYGSAQKRDGEMLDTAIARQYLATKLWRLDGLFPVVLDGDGNEATEGPAFAYVEDLEGTRCRTVLYLHDGHIYEYFGLDGLDFVPGDGEAILEVDDVRFTRTDNGVRVELDLPNGETESLAVGHRSEVD